MAIAACRPCASPAAPSLCVLGFDLPLARLLLDGLPRAGLLRSSSGDQLVLSGDSRRNPARDASGRVGLNHALAHQVVARTSLGAT